jgi:queuine tRNA-ribosyltransferase
MGWSGPILTDSGGFQLHSLDHLCQRSEEGVRFKSPVDGTECFLSPERCIEVQEALGADLIVTLDEFEPIPPEPAPGQETRVRELLERTLRWARRCQRTQGRSDQLLFGIVQGGGFIDLRAESAERTHEIGFGAYAIGGLGLGESPGQRAALLEAALAPLPVEKPRYLMGLGMPQDLVDAVARGVDLFDCVIPTRHGRHGSVFGARGPLNLRNAAFREDAEPIDPACSCAVCARYSRAYLRHLIVSGEMLGPRLLSLHNVAFYMQLLEAMRAAITDDRFESWRARWQANYGLEESGGARSKGSSAATHSAA